MSTESSRRQLLRAAALAGAGTLTLGGPALADGAIQPADVNATEDLMREHGVLRRVLLVYGEGIRQIEKGQTPPAAVLSSAAGIIKHFVEGYHEKLEEEQLFPRLEKAGLQVDLVHTLKAQHVAGRKLTDAILAVANPTALAKPASRDALVTAAKSFIRMYEPHAAREDTILFPAFHALFTEKQFDELGDRFEEQEKRLLGAGGFEGAVKEVADLERALGIYDLNQLTPT